MPGKTGSIFFKSRSLPRWQTAGNDGFLCTGIGCKDRYLVGRSSAPALKTLRDYVQSADKRGWRPDFFFLLCVDNWTASSKVKTTSPLAGENVRGLLSGTSTFLVGRIQKFSFLDDKNLVRRPSALCHIMKQEA